MLTRKQQQGIKILESIVQSEFPFVVSLDLSTKYPLSDYATTMGVKMEIDPVTLSKFLDIPFNKKFDENPTLWTYYIGEKGIEIAFLMHFFDDEYQEETGWKFNNKMEAFITKAYSQLPSNMRINIYSHSPENEIPDWALGKLNNPRAISIDKFSIAKDSNIPMPKIKD